jgi:hypothetical protein
MLFIPQEFSLAYFFDVAQHSELAEGHHERVE